MGLIWQLIVGGIIGWLGGLILGKDVPGGVIGNIIAGFIGSWIGGQLFQFGPVVADFYVIPSIIGAVILIFVLSLILKNTNKHV